MKRLFLVSGLSAFVFLFAAESVELRYIPGILIFAAAVCIITAAVRVFLYVKKVEVGNGNEFVRFLELAAVSCLSICICGSVYYQSLNCFKAVADRYDGESVHATLQILSEERFGDSGVGYFEAKPVKGIDTQGFSVKVFSEGVPDGELYDYVEGDFDLASSEGGYYLSDRADGIVLSAYSDELTVIPCSEKPIMFKLAELRQYVSRIITRCFGEAQGFVKAILLGDRSDMRSEDFASLRGSGLLHVTAVSGLHVGIAAVFMLAVLSSVKSRPLKYSLIVFVLLFLAAVTGFSPSVVRAVFMTSAAYVGKLALRKTDSLNFLGLVLTAYLFINPFSVYSASLLLSFSASMGIIIFAAPLQKAITTWLFKVSGKYLNGFFTGVVSTLAVSVACTVFTVPVSSFLFGTFSLAGIITNILCLWLIKYIFILSAFVVMLGWFPLGEPLFSLISLIVNGGVSYIMWVSDIFATTVISDMSAQPVNIIIAAIVGYVAYILLGLKKKKTDTKKKKQASRIAASVIIAIIVLVATVLAQGFKKPNDNRLHGVFVDVGQGSCSYVSYNEKAVVFDCGGSKAAGEALNRSLRERGIRDIECVVLSHLHSDHTNGLKDLFTEWDIDTVYYADSGDSPESLMELNSLVAEEGALSLCVTGDITVELGEFKVELLTEHFDPAVEDGNENSMVAVVTHGNVRIMFTGDVSAEGERRLIDAYELALNSDVLCVPHHGSANSSCPEFLAVVDPDFSIISVGKNSYGLPSNETVNRLLGYGEVYSTMVLGTVELVSDGISVEIVE